MSTCTGQTHSTEPQWPNQTEITAPERGVVHVWCASLGCEEAGLAEKEQRLPADELERATRLRTEALRHRFLVSRLVMRQILGGCLGVRPEEVRFDMDPTGKPCLRAGSSIQFNLAHSGDLMLLAVTRRVPVGVDIEQIRPMRDAHAIARRFFTEREATWLGAVGADNLHSAFFRLWTRKEAILKATGEGISGGLSAIELLDGDGRFLPTVAQGADKSSWSVIELTPASGFVGALVLPAGCCTLDPQRRTYRLT